MFDLSIVGTAAVALMVLACPLMMLGMMGMAVLPFTRGRSSKRGGHKMCHGGAHGTADDEESPQAP